MDGELLRALYHELFHHHNLKSGPRFTFDDAVILWVYFLGALYNRSPRWAREKRHWPLWARHLKVPSYSQLMRRLKADSVNQQIDRINSDICQKLPTSTNKMADGKPLLVGSYSKDPDAKVGRLSANAWGCGFKLHAIINEYAIFEAFSVTGLNAGEATILRSLVNQVALQDAILRADANYDSNPTYAAVANAGGRFVAPRRKPGRGLGNRKHHPDRLQAIEEIEGDADRAKHHRRQRVRIEQAFAHLTNLPFGLSPLPNFVRRLARVRRWVATKILLYHLHLANKLKQPRAA